MPRTFDIRLQGERRRQSERIDEIRRAAVVVSETLPGQHHLVLDSIDSRSGNAALIRSVGALPAGNDLAAAAIDHLDRIRAVLGLTADQTRFDAAPRMLTTTSGATAVHLRQSVSDLPVFQAVRTVVFDPDRRIRATEGLSFSPTPGAGREPTVSPVDAVVAAARHLVAFGDADSDQPSGPVLDLASFSPEASASSPDPNRRTTVTAPPLVGPVEASLLWFDVDTTLRLGWEVLLGLPDEGDRYRVIVDAHAGDVLYSQSTTFHVAARGNVALPNPGTPRQMHDFPLPLWAYPVPTPAGLPALFPPDWVAVDGTDGDNVRALLPVPAAASGPPAKGALVDGVMTFNPADPAGDDQRRVAAFFLCNYMHNLLYLLGFREVDGNFQSSGSFGRDAVVAVIHPAPLPFTANMDVSHSDAVYPTMNLGPYQMPGGRHSALDAGVVFHEYTHGLTTRLVGGFTDSANLAAVQSGSLGEGWSDYMGCTLTNTTVIGAWMSAQPAGVRGFAYDEAFPDHFGNLGTGRYNQVHRNGEIWCAALLELNRRIGIPLTLQLVVDGLKLTPANPSYLQARDAILDALEDKQQTEGWDTTSAQRVRRQAWRAFATFGMGFEAKAGSSLDYAGIVADFRVPPYPATIYAITENTLDPVTGRITPSGSLLWYRHDGRPNGMKSWTTASGRVGSDWDFAHVFGAGEGVIYAITSRVLDPVTGAPKGGDLLWYRHDGWRDGNKDRWTAKPESPVARRWSYRQVFSGGDGVIYAIRDNGDLLWHRHDGWRDGTDRWTTPVDPRIGRGWNFTEVFSGGGGALYAVTERGLDPATGERTGGDLIWFRHDGWRDGSDRWMPGGRTVNRRWDSVETFSGGDGVIYARRSNGDLHWYRHDGWHDGEDVWAPGSGQRVGSGWKFKQVLAS